MGVVKKFIYALLESWKVFFPVRNPYVVMTLLVKNEEEMLEANLRFHKAMGIDAFIITDNNSTDTTPNIIDKYVRKGWIIEVINETGADYEQKKWVDRMIWNAKVHYHADWVVNADADEFWYVPSGNLKTELSATRANVLTCEMRSMYPDESRPFDEWDYAVKPVPDPETYDLSLYSIFERQNRKVIHRTDGYLQISMGNHKVKMFPQCPKKSDIRIYHYNIRGRKQFIEKMVNGGKQLEQHKGRHGGRHWRYFYKLYKEGKLDEEYERVVGTPIVKELKEHNFIYEDSTITVFLKKLKDIDDTYCSDT